MLDGYVSEKEQLESIAKWWKENGKWLITAIVIGLLLGFGWRYFHRIEMRRLENASMIYQSVLQADQQKQLTTSQGGAFILMKNFPKTPYASLAALLFAQEAISQNQFTVALTKLNWVIQHAKSVRQKQIARIAAARIFLSQNNTDAALKMLSVVNDQAFMPLIYWVKGDVAAKMGDAQLAEKNYQKAKTGLADFPPAMNLLNQLIAN